MTQTRSTQSSGTGQIPRQAGSPSGLAFLRSHFSKVNFLEILAWANRHSHLDLGEMDLGQWPPRPASSTVKPVGSKPVS
jgi:hypothetical protein